jgi:hypothetical protein
MARAANALPLCVAQLCLALMSWSLIVIANLGR